MHNTNGVPCNPVATVCLLTTVKNIKKRRKGTYSYLAPVQSYNRTATVVVILGKEYKYDTENEQENSEKVDDLAPVEFRMGPPWCLWSFDLGEDQTKPREKNLDFGQMEYCSKPWQCLKFSRQSYRTNKRGQNMMSPHRYFAPADFWKTVTVAVILWSWCGL